MAKPIQNDQWAPSVINSVEETGLQEGFLIDLVLKIMYFKGQITGYEVAAHVRLPFQNVVRPILETIKREQFCEVRGSGGLGAGGYQYVITDKGAGRAREQLERTTYVDAAPVPWNDYIEGITTQGMGRILVNETTMKTSLAHLIIDERVFSKIGPAVNSGKSIFLYGAPGNGKTAIAESVGRMILKHDIYIPYAVEVDGQIIKVYDEINHQRVEEQDTPGTKSLNSQRPDMRWVKIKRPVIMVGGELTLAGLDLVYDPINKYYEAPFQMKANGGMFLIDDFGRQQVRPQDLLNRWIVPMEKNADFLALHTGRKMEVPFNVLLVFSTNLPPKDLVDEAFLRRIRHKIEITSPSFDTYREIFQRVCDNRGIPYDDNAVKYLLQAYYIKPDRPLRASHPRDIIDQLQDIANYLSVRPRLTKELLDQAATSYFVDLTD